MQQATMNHCRTSGATFWKHSTIIPVPCGDHATLSPASIGLFRASMQILKASIRVDGDRIQYLRGREVYDDKKYPANVALNRDPQLGILANCKAKDSAGF